MYIHEVPHAATWQTCVVSLPTTQLVCLMNQVCSEFHPSNPCEDFDHIFHALLSIFSDRFAICLVIDKIIQYIVGRLFCTFTPPKIGPRTSSLNRINIRGEVLRTSLAEWCAENGVGEVRSSRVILRGLVLTIQGIGRNARIGIHRIRDAAAKND